ncbi:MAG: cell division protein FtsQ/DivIB [Motiliproteus sp.]|nr:cell division protein FtsQ/DivIB [Motiliproteus sp.]
MKSRKQIEESIFGGLSLYVLLLVAQLPILALMLYFGGNWAQQWFDHPLENVEVQGSLKHTSAKSLRLQVWDRTEGSYLDIDLAEVKALLEADPWVYRVDVRRQWPAGLKIEIDEERPVARWGCKGLLNSDGNILQPTDSSEYAHLPCLKGPENRTLVMMEQFRSLNQQMRPLKLQMTALHLEPRGAWSLTLNNGIQLILGRGNLIEKMERFGRVYDSQLAVYASKIKQIDARYTNGLTVTWHEPPKV